MDLIKATNLGIRFKMKRKKPQVTLSDTKKTDRRVNASEFWALKNVNFTVEKGDILGVIGSNGSGKSTLLRLISEVYSPDEGTIEINGSVSALLSLGAGFKSELSGLENIYLNGIMLGFSKTEIDKHLEQIIEFSEIGEFINEPVKVYSSGMRSRLGFSISAFLERDVMLIDEILGVGDFKFKKKSQEKMEEMIRDGRTVIIVSHSMDSIKKYSNKAIWIEKGEMKASGKAVDIVELYLKS
ncbi:MAG: ABC transporter ATP-binding protein [Flavobacteriales bacterium]|jgi:ABC-type polysaccharide/polyol phosphate transport system ATPase subunit|nr:ABC transporter ATP-binding protein [Flavobacteriales bacterium]